MGRNATTIGDAIQPGANTRRDGRLFLEPLRADAEIRRRAESLFLTRGLFGTRGRDAVLVLARGSRDPDSRARHRIAALRKLLKTLNAVIARSEATRQSDEYKAFSSDQIAALRSQ